MDDQLIRLPQAAPVTLRVARAAKVIGMPVTQAQCADVFRRLGLPFTEGEGTLTRDAAELALRPEDRGRPDRGGDPRHRLRQAAPTPPLAPVTAPVRPRRAAACLRRAPCAGRRWTTRRRSTSASSRSAGSMSWPATPTRSACSTRSPAPLAVMRSSLIGSLVQVLQATTWRARPSACACSRSAACSCATRGAGQRRAVAGVDQPMRVAGLAYGPAEPAVGQRERAVDFFDVKGDVEALLAPRQARFVADSHPALHPGRCARVELDGQPSATSANCTRAGARPTTCRRRRCCSNSTSTPCSTRPVPAFSPVPRQQAVCATWRWWWPTAWPHDALMAPPWLADDRGPGARATLFDIYKPASPVAAWPSTNAAWPCAWTAGFRRNTLTDERIDAVAGGRGSGACSRHSARACALSARG
jgi:phenylalanyl-tRNA synthetase beta chain